MTSVTAAVHPDGRGCTSEYAAAPAGDRRCVLEPGHGQVLHFNRAGFSWDDGEAAESARAVIEMLRHDGARADLARIIAARALADGLDDIPHPTYDQLRDIARGVCPDGCPAGVLDNARAAYDRLVDDVRRRLTTNHTPDTPEEARRG